MKSIFAFLGCLLIAGAGFAGGYFYNQSQARFQTTLQGASLIRTDRFSGETWAFSRESGDWVKIEEHQFHGRVVFDAPFVPWTGWRDSYYDSMARSYLKTRKALDDQEARDRANDTPAIEDANEWGDQPEKP